MYLDQAPTSAFVLAKCFPCRCQHASLSPLLDLYSPHPLPHSTPSTPFLFYFSHSTCDLLCTVGLFMYLCLWSVFPERLKDTQGQRLLSVLFIPVSLTPCRAHRRQLKCVFNKWVKEWMDSYIHGRIWERMPSQHKFWGSQAGRVLCVKDKNWGQRAGGRVVWSKGRAVCTDQGSQSPADWIAFWISF